MNIPSEHITVDCAENCGNSPKKELLKDLTIAHAKHDIDFCLDWLTDDVVWDMIGDQSIQGKRDVEKILKQWKDHKVQHLRIQNIITHGDTGSVNGTITFSDQQSVAFCHVYNFRGFGKKAKIKTITSYMIQL